MKTSRKRRPKAIYAKGWETRRAKTLKGMDLNQAQNALKRQMLDGVATGQKGQASGPSPEVDAIARTLEINREEQLLGFMGDMSAARHMRRHNDHHPIMVTRAQAEALEQFLSDHGYSAWGKGSGTDPNVRKAA